MTQLEKNLAAFARVVQGIPPKSTQRRTDPDVVQRIREMAGEGFTGPAIERVLSGDPEYADRTPSLRTIQDIAREQPVHDEWWSVAEASAEEARLVLPVLAERVRYLRGTHGLRGTVRLAKGLGVWIAKVRAIHPDMPPGEAYRVAWRYWLNPSPELDEALALWHAESREQDEPTPGISALPWA